MIIERRLKRKINGIIIELWDNVSFGYYEILVNGFLYKYYKNLCLAYDCYKELIRNAKKKIPIKY